MGSKQPSEWEKAFTQGYYCAVTSYIKEFGANAVARDLIKAMLHSVAKLRRYGVDEYDISVCGPIITEILAEERKNNRQDRATKNVDRLWAIIKN